MTESKGTEAGRFLGGLIMGAVASWFLLAIPILLLAAGRGWVGFILGLIFSLCVLFALARAGHERSPTLGAGMLSAILMLLVVFGALTRTLYAFSNWGH